MERRYWAQSRKDMLKKMIKKIALCTIVALLVSMIAGCGKQKKDTENTEAEIPQQVVQTEAPAMEVTTEGLPVGEDGYYISNDYVKTIGETINVRVSPSTDANIYKLLAGGEVLNRVGYNDEWTKVLVDGNTFYIYSEYVVQTEPPAGVIGDAAEQKATETDVEREEKVVVIDPANQAVVNAEQVEIGPDSEVTKQGASTGNVGTTLGTKESELNLTYAKLLKAELETRGYEVVLTRDTDEINLSNKARAEIANESSATTFVRIQMNFSENDALSGVMSVCMTADSTFNGNLHKDSYRLATRLLEGVLEKTACVNQGIYETDQMTAINWSQIPVALVKLGYLSNAEDEAKLVDASYQQQVVKGLADGLDAYYGY